MMCQRIGRPPISIIGFGRTDVSSEIRVPMPPARMTAFTIPPAFAKIIQKELSCYRSDRDRRLFCDLRLTKPKAAATVGLHSYGLGRWRHDEPVIAAFFNEY